MYRSKFEQFNAIPRFDYLDFFPGWPGERIIICADVEAVVVRLRETYRREKTVVLASGDPLFYGIGRRLLRSFPKEDLLFLRSDITDRRTRTSG